MTKNSIKRLIKDLIGIDHKPLGSDNVSGGRYREVDDFSVNTISQKNLNLIVDALERFNIDYFIIRSSSITKYRVGVVDSDKHKLISAIEKVYGSEESSVIMGAQTEGGVNSRSYTSNTQKISSLITENDTVSIWAVYRYKGRRVAGAGYSCDIEFWRSGDDLDDRGIADRRLMQIMGVYDKKPLQGALVAPRENEITMYLLPTEQKEATKIIGGRSYRTKAVFNKRLVHDIDFPIDVVYTWVDGSDTEWIGQYNKYSKTERSVDSGRFASDDELKYSLRSIHMYAPFVRNIYIVTAGQRPHWLKEGVGRVKIVDHKDIFSDKRNLPTFNSHSIGAQLHNIKGLSERYVYFNDDVFLGRPTSADTFFTPSGIAKVSMSSRLIGAGPILDCETAPGSAGKNVRDIIYNDFGRYITNKVKHAPHPQLKSVAKELESIYAESVNKTAASRFRSKHDIAFAGILHHNYALITGRAINSKYKVKTIDIWRDDVVSEMKGLLQKRNAGAFCLNESIAPSYRSPDVLKSVHNFLESYFPVPAPWEALQEVERSEARDD